MEHSDINTEAIFIKQNASLSVGLSFEHDSLNKVFDALFREKLGQLDEERKWGFDVKLEATDNAEILFEEMHIDIRIPISVDLSRDDLLKMVKASASIILNFKSEFSKDSLGRIVSKTELKDYEWIDKPAVSLSQWNISISKLANWMLESRASELEAMIDQIINTHIDPSGLLDQLCEKLSDGPLYVTNNNIEYHLRPDSLTIGPFKNELGRSKTDVRVELSSYVIDSSSIIGLPASNGIEVTFDEADNSSSILHCVGQVDFSKLNLLLKKSISGNKLEKNNYKITIEDLEARMENEKLLLELLVSGDFKGRVLFEAIPEFSKDEQKFVLQDFDFSVKSKNILKSAGLFLMKSKIKNEILKAFDLSIKERIQEFQDIVDTQITKLPIDDFMQLGIAIRHIEFDHFIIEDQRLMLDLQVEVDAAVRIKSFQKLLEFSG